MLASLANFKLIHSYLANCPAIIQMTLKHLYIYIVFGSIVHMCAVIKNIPVIITQR